MAVMGISYNDGGKPELDYKYCYLNYGDKADKEVVFDSGDLVQDWYDLNKFIIHNKIQERDGWVGGSSTIDNFIMDGAQFDSAYLMPDKDDNWELSYDRKNWGNGIEFFVPTGERPTWEELKVKYGKAK